MIVVVTGLLSAWSASADQTIADQYPSSLLYSKPIEVIPHVWSAIGATAPANYDDAGHNNNLTFIESGNGVIVINSGASFLLAKALHEEIRRISTETVVMVINENGQGHAMLGNSYWAEQGIPILAHADAAAAFDENGYESLAQLKRYARERATYTSVVPPTETVNKTRILDSGDFPIEIRWLGPSHSAGDIAVWLPQQRLVVSGDMAFHERLLPIFEATDTASWLDSWEKFEALRALYVIPGHGHPTNMAQVKRYTKDYLLYLRAEVGKLLADGEDLQAAYEIDQSPYAHLHTFDELAKRNAGRVF